MIQLVILFGNLNNIFIKLYHYYFFNIIFIVFPILIEKTDLKFNGSFLIFVILTILVSIYLWFNLPDSRDKQYTDYINDEISHKKN